MGADIHMFYELKINGKWELYDWQAKYRSGNYEDGSPRYNWSEMWEDVLSINRNYRLFALLAGVRNDGSFEPIKSPISLPYDVSDKVKAEHDSWGIDAHSATWYMLDELLNYDYNQQDIGFSGVISREQFFDIENGNTDRPKIYSQQVIGRYSRTISNEEMRTIDFDDGLSYYTRWEWVEKCREAVGKAWFDVLAELSRIKQLKKVEDVRLIMWFDN